MSCVRTALEASHCLVSACKDVYDLSFSFVSPLEAEYNVKFHYCSIYSFQLEWKVIIWHIFYSRLWLCRLYRLYRLCWLWLVSLLLVCRLLRLCLISALLSLRLSSEKLESVSNDFCDISLVSALVVP